MVFLLIKWKTAILLISLVHFIDYSPHSDELFIGDGFVGSGLTHCRFLLSEDLCCFAVLSTHWRETGILNEKNLKNFRPPQNCFHGGLCWVLDEVLQGFTQDGEHLVLLVVDGRLAFAHVGSDFTLRLALHDKLADASAVRVKAVQLVV